MSMRKKVTLDHNRSIKYITHIWSEMLTKNTIPQGIIISIYKLEGYIFKWNMHNACIIKIIITI